MLLDMCGCSTERVKKAEEGGSGCMSVCEGGGLGRVLQGHAVELCARLHYPADLVMTAAAQEERSGSGGVGSPRLQTNDDEEITLKNNLHNISCSLGSSQAAWAARLTALSIDLIHCRSYSSHIVFQINDTADRNDIYININPEKN